MWMFAVLLILAAGMFPLQAVVGQGASEQAWQTAFLLVFACGDVADRDFHPGQPQA